MDFVFAKLIKACCVLRYSIVKSIDIKDFLYFLNIPNVMWQTERIRSATLQNDEMSVFLSTELVDSFGKLGVKPDAIARC